MVGFTFNGELLAPSLVNGIAQAGTYGLLAVALVLTYRVSRTVAFVHGGLAMAGAMTYSWLTDLPGYVGPHPALPGLVALLLVVAGGAGLGGLYGGLVTGRRMSEWPKLTLTTFSLGVLLLITGLVSVIFVLAFGVAGRAPSPFGDATVRLFDVNVTVHQLVTIAIIVVLAAVLALFLARTRAGVYLRAVADDVEASRWVGVPLRRVGTAAYCVAGGLAALAGALTAPILSPNLFDVYFVFLRALTAAVLGGFSSFGLALAGAALFGVADTSLRTGVVGETTPGQRELLVMGVVFLGVAMARYRRHAVEVLDVEGL